MSIEASTSVNNVLLSLSKNPLLYDESYHVPICFIQKLIGLNKKTLLHKQNRANNLARREEKAELELQK